MKITGFVRVLECFGKLKRLVLSFSRNWKVLEKFSKWQWESFEFLFGKILKYPKMDISQCRMKHHPYYVCSLHYL